MFLLSFSERNVEISSSFKDGNCLKAILFSLQKYLVFVRIFSKLSIALKAWIRQHVVKLCFGLKFMSAFGYKELADCFDQSQASQKISN